jgi:hypothetical protein
MRKLLLLLTTIISLSAKAQTSVYHPFPDSGAVWNVYNKLNDGTYIHQYWESLYYPGPVIAAFGNIYRELWVSGFQSDFFLPVGPMTYSSYNHYTGYALRDDSAQHTVYFYDVAQEQVFLDFNFQIGDTLSSHGIPWVFPFAITSIDSVLIGGSYRKRYNFQSLIGVPAADTSIIEGIGSTSGLFWEPWNFFERGGHLDCFSLFNNQLYPVFNSTPCGIMAVDEISKSNNLFEVFPNPFNDKLNFTFKSEGVNEIILYDLASRKLLRQEFSKTLSLNTEQLAKGLYLYEVRNKDGSNKKGKIVKD